MSTQAQAQAKILYRKTIDGGSDTEGNLPNGVEVTLSVWKAESYLWLFPDHYILSKIVMIDRELVVDESVLIKTSSSFNEDAKQIEQAIDEIEYLKKLLPKEDEL